MNVALLIAPLREQPLRAAVTILAIALGVALSSAVYLVNAGALDEFAQAARKLLGDTDLVVRGPRSGFSEQLYGQVARLPGIETADPVLEVDAALPDAMGALAAAAAQPRAGLPATLHVIGLDPFRAAAIQPALLGELGSNPWALLGRDGIFLSAPAATALGKRVGDPLEVIVGVAHRSLRVLGILSASSYPERLGLMDIAAAQWTFDRLGELNRIDLRLAPGADVPALRRELARLLPPGVNVVLPELERDRARNVTRAYRVNLNMLALVSLLTGAFLVFSTQTLSVLRRRSALALLRAVGMTRGELERLLLGEGLLLGFLGAVLGVILGELIAGALLALIAGDLGNGQLALKGVALQPQPLAWIAFVALGTAVAAVGAWVPAREAAARPPALALKAGDAESGLARLRTAPAGVVLLVTGSALALLPAIGGLPVFGYAAIAALLFGAVLLVPTVSSRLLARAPHSGRVSLDLGLAQLQGSVGQSTISLAAIIVSFSLMIAMAVMVYSFRVSFEDWLGRLLPADLQLRVAAGSDTVYLSPAEQLRIRDTAGIARVDFRRSRSIALAADRPPVLLLARAISPARAADSLALVESLPDGPQALRIPAGTHDQAPDTAANPAPPLPPLWVSEAMVDRYGARLGAAFELPLEGRRVEFRVVGVFRDYGRSTGAVVIVVVARARCGRERDPAGAQVASSGA